MAGDGSSSSAHPSVGRLRSSLIRAGHPLAIFRHRNFSFVWASVTLVSMGTQMEMVVLGWFILTLTDSPFLVGLISAARMSLNILALFAGTIADRLPRHRVLATVEFMMACFGLMMLTLILLDRLEVWHIFALTVFGGLVRVFQMPSAQSLVADTLPEERIGSGAAINTVGMNLAMLIGPLVGGLLFNGFGAQGAFAAIAVLYFASGVSALSIRIERRGAPRERESVIRAMIGGLKYVKGDQVLWGTLLLVLIIESSGWTFHTTLMPIFAREVLETDAGGLGLLLFAFGIGAVIGSVSLASVRDLRHVGKLMIVAVVFWHATILAFSASHSFYLSMAIIVFTGAGFASTQVLILSALLRSTRSEYRGRVMGLRSMAIYAFAMGSVSSGAIAGLWGAPLAAIVVGVGGIALVLTLALFTSELRRF